MVEPLSKKIQLGVIILALQILRRLKIPFLPRLVSLGAEALGISRKAGYEAAEDIQAILRSPAAIGVDQALRWENLRLRIRNQVLAFERDHPGVRFSDRHVHLPSEARSLCVRVFRDLKGQLTNSQIAASLGVPLASLSRWCSQADQEGRFPPKPERRGTHRRTGPEDIQRVLQEHEALCGDMTLEEFSATFNEKHPEHTLARGTIARILKANGRREIETRGGPPPYHGHFQVYYPGAQVSVDAKRCDVVFTAGRREVITLAKEVGIDIATGAILGAALEKTENSHGVDRVLVQVREEYLSVLSLLSDNGSANRAADAQGIFQWEGGSGRIFSFPYHPMTNGHVEGLFGQFARIVGTIEIDDTSRETIAASVVEVVWRVFIHFHNHSPRARLGGKSPFEYFRQYVPKPEEVDAARKGLGAQREKSLASRKPHPRLSDPGFRSQVEGLLLRHRLPAAIDDALRALLPYDLGVIQRASDAFFAQSEREGFDERKRTLPYLVGIVRNKQREADSDRLRSEHLRRETARKLAEMEENRKQLQEERRREAEDLRLRPERIILWNAEMLLRGGLKLASERWLEGLRSGLASLRKLGRATANTLERIAATIRSWEKYREHLRDAVAKLLLEEAARIAPAPT